MLFPNAVIANPNSKYIQPGLKKKKKSTTEIDGIKSQCWILSNTIYISREKYIKNKRKNSTTTTTKNEEKRKEIW